MATTLTAPVTNTTSSGLIKDAALLHREVRRIQADQGDLSRLGFVVEMGPLNTQGGITQKVPYLELDGQGGMTALTEVESMSASTYAAEVETLSASRFGVDLPISDRMRAHNAIGLDIPMLAEMIVQRRRVTRNTNICTAWETATNVVGTSTAAFTTAHIYDALAAARIANIKPILSGPLTGFYVVVLHPVQANELDTAVRALGNILRERQDIQEFSRFMPGTFMGVFERCLVYQIDTVQDDGTDYAGALLGNGAILSTYEDQALPTEGRFAQKFPDLPGFMLELERTARAAKTSVIGNDYHGFTARDEAIVRLRSGS